MKATSSYKMSKSTKRMAATMIDPNERNHFLRSMKDAELTAASVVKKNNFKKSEDKDEQE